MMGVSDSTAGTTEETEMPETFTEKIERLTYRTACELVRRADAITVAAGNVLTEQALRYYKRGEGWDARFAALNLED